MPHHLTAGQRAQLEAALTMRLHQLERNLSTHQDGQSRPDHAREVLLSDADDAPQRDADREVDLMRSDLELDELGRVSRALRRVHAPEYGYCIDCGAEIAFDRLRVEPQALRCVACEARQER